MPRYATCVDWRGQVQQLTLTSGWQSTGRPWRCATASRKPFTKNLTLPNSAVVDGVGAERREHPIYCRYLSHAPRQTEMLALVAVATGAILAGAFTLITQRRTLLSEWDASRHQTYSKYMVSVATGRRQLMDRAYSRLEHPLTGVPDDERDKYFAIHIDVIARYNEVRVISSSTEVVSHAAEMLVVIDTLRGLLEAFVPPLSSEEVLALEAEVDKSREKYETNRLGYIAALQHELRAVRRTDGLLTSMKRLVSRWPGRSTE